jgi:hypothetical protein
MIRRAVLVVVAVVTFATVAVAGTRALPFRDVRADVARDLAPHLGKLGQNRGMGMPPQASHPYPL